MHFRNRQMRRALWFDRARVNAEYACEINRTDFSEQIVGHYTDGTPVFTFDAVCFMRYADYWILHSKPHKANKRPVARKSRR